MMYIWLEWICSRCETLHRTRFEIFPTFNIPKSVLNHAYMKDNIYIMDAASKSKPSRRRQAASCIYARVGTKINYIIDILEEYMLKYYAVKEDTLTLEVCRE